jgi:hypothetical protein
MDIAKLVLEYLTLLLSWPVVLGLLVVYFLKRHGQAVNNILTRVNSVSFPGGVTLGTAVYPSEPTDQSDSGVRFSRKATEPVEALDKDFSNFLWQGIALNRVAVGLEIDRLWTQLMGGPFPPTILTGSESKTQAEKLRVMKDKYKIDERAIQDFDFLEELTKDRPRSDLVLAYNKSHALKAYLSRLSPTFWKT